MFQLTEEETKSLRFQFATSKKGRGGRRYLPYAQMNISIIRAFIKLREMLLTHKDLAQRMEKLEQLQGKQGEQITEIYAFLKKLIEAPVKPLKRIGFDTSDK